MSEADYYLQSMAPTLEKLAVGDLVACYITNSEVYDALFQWGLILDVNKTVGDVLVIDNGGYMRWWPRKRWRLLKSKPLKPVAPLKTPGIKLA